MITKKIVISQVRKYLKKKADEKPADKETYLDFLNSGIYVDLNRVKKSAFKIMDRLLNDFESESK